MAFSESFIIKAVDNFSPVVRKVNKQTDAFKKKMQGLTKQIEKSKFIFAAAFLAISGAMIGTVVAAAKFEKGMTNVYTLLGKKQLKKYKGDLDAAGNAAIRMGFSLDDMTKGLFDSQSAIGKVDKTLKLYNVAQKLAIGGVTNLATSVDGLTSIVNAYGKETTKATDVANAFFSAQLAGKTTVALLAANVGKVAPVAKQAGIGFKTLLATMSQLTLGGLSTEEASTALRGAIAGLIDPIGDAKAIFEKYNIPVGAAALQSADFVNVLGQIAKVAKKDKDALAKMIPNIRALTAIASLGAPQLENLRGIVSNINIDIEKGTGLNEAYAIQMATFTQQFKMAKGEVFLLAKNIGVILLPYALILLKTFIKLIKYLDGLSPSTKASILVIGVLAAAFAALMAGIGAVLFILPALSAAFLLTWAAVTGPVGAVVLAIFGVVWALKKVYMHWQDFATVVDFVFEKLLALKNLITDFPTSKLSKIVIAALGPAGIPLKLLAAGGGEEAEVPYKHIPARKFQPLPTSGATNKTNFAADININAPKGVVGSVTSKATGFAKSNVGLNMPAAQ